MSLPRNAENEPQILESQKASEEISQEVDQISAMVRRMAQKAGGRSGKSQQNEKLLLMASAVMEMCQNSQTLSGTISGEMKRMNETQQQNLNQQKVFAESVKAATHEATANIYHNLRNQEKQAVNELMQYVQANSDQMEKDLTACVGNVRAATKAAEQATRQISRSAERFRKIKTIRDLLYYAAPVLVAVDIILRVADAVAQYL